MVFIFISHSMLILVPTSENGLDIVNSKFRKSWFHC